MMSPVSAIDSRAAPPGPVAFTRGHLLAILEVWYPLNPAVVAWFAAKFSEVFLAGTLHVGLPTPARALFALTVTILGPFTAMIEGRNRLDCWRNALWLLPWCAGPIVAALVLQLLWRPRGRIGRAARMFLWGLGFFAWLSGGFVSVLLNSG
jgi:hypothetical protein